MILITGSTGELGKETIKALLKLVPAQQIVALARDPEKATTLLAAGINVRKGDYSDYDSLLAAFTGVEKLLLISPPAFSGPDLGENTILAAKNAGVKYIAYTGFQEKKGSGWVIPGVTEMNVHIEQLLADSDIAYTIVHNGLYADAFSFLLGSGVLENGVLFPSGDGRAAVVARADLGEALARIMTATDLYPQHITLSNSENWSAADIAKILSEVIGKTVPFLKTSPADYISYLEASGIPNFYAGFAADWAAAIKAGEFEETDKLLEQILGRKPVSLKAVLQTVYQPVYKEGLEIKTPVSFT